MQLITFRKRNYLMKNLLFIPLIILSGQILGQEVMPGKFAFSFTPQAGGLVTDNGRTKTKFGFGIKAEGLYRITLVERLQLLVGPSFQSAEVASRSNNLHWPSDQANGEWVPGLSYEEYKANFISIGATGQLQYALPGQKQNWILSGGTSFRYVLDYSDILTINESGNLWEYTSEPLVTDINRSQFFVDFGINYSMKISEKRRITFGPEIEYSVVDFLQMASSNLLWSYRPSYPVFFGFRIMAY